jgi:hypothetical protein
VYIAFKIHSVYNFQGRARSRDAEYIILIEGEHYDQFMSELKTYHQIEKVKNILISLVLYNCSLG